ncbi:MAG: sugar ABC transporter substrate-binding protein [Rectinemataceae bacterium]
MKRVLLVLLVLALVVGTAVAAPKNGKKIFMSNAYYTAPYCGPLNKGVQLKAEELDYTIQIVDGEGSADKQLAQFKAAVAEGYNGLIYFPADQASTPPVIEYLNSTKLPYIVLNTRVDPGIESKVPCTVASDEVEIGRNIGRMAATYLKNKGQIVYIEGAAGASFTVNVTKGINEIFAKTSIKILNTHQYSDWDPGKAMKIMEDFLTKYGKDKINLVVCQDGGMFQGALSAIDAAGLKGTLKCVASGNDLIIKESILDGSLLGTSIQDPYIEGALGATSLDKLMRGQKVDKWVVTPGGLCLKADVGKHNWF